MNSECITETNSRSYGQVYHQRVKGPLTCLHCGQTFIAETVCPTCMVLVLPNEPTSILTEDDDTFLYNLVQNT